MKNIVINIYKYYIILKKIDLFFFIYILKKLCYMKILYVIFVIINIV